MATDVYFGVCPNVPADFKTGSPTIIIASGIATFSVAQTSLIMGIGAVVDYDVDNKIAYISGKITTSIWAMINADGTTPSNVTDVTVNSISHPFTSAQTASASVGALMGGTNLNTLDLQLNIPAYCRQDTYDLDDAGAITFTFTGDSDHKVKYFTPEDTDTQCNFDHRPRNNGAWDTTKYIFQGSTSGHDKTVLLTGATMSVEIVGIQFYFRYTGGSGGATLIRVTDGVIDLLCTNNVMRIANTTYERNFINGMQGGSGWDGSVINVFNNVMYFEAKSIHTKSYAFRSSGAFDNVTWNICENTIINAYIPARLEYSWGNNIISKNNVFLNTSASCIDCGTNWSNNIWRDFTTGYGTDIQTTQTDAQLFTSVSSNVWTWDFLPKEGSDLKDAGARLDGSTPDVSGDLVNPLGLRPWGAGWDVGALEIHLPCEILPIINRRRCGGSI